MLDSVREAEQIAHIRAFPGPAAIATLIEDGVLPRDTPVGEVLVQIVGPLTLGAIFAPEQITPGFADRLVERLVRGYAGEQDRAP